MKAQDFLRKGADLLEERGKQYDQPGGERSMGKAVSAFNTITGRSLSEAEGWLLLQVLKDVRQWQNPDKYHADSAEDCVSYAALKAEALAVEGGIQAGWTQDAIDYAAFTGAELHAAGLGPRDVLGEPLPCNSQVRGIYVDPYDLPPISASSFTAMPACKEPAASIDDDSARAQVVQQNGEMAVEVYAAIDDAPSWDDAPEWANVYTTDDRGAVWWDTEPQWNITLNRFCWIEDVTSRIESVNSRSYHAKIYTRPTKEAI